MDREKVESKLSNKIINVSFLENKMKCLQKVQEKISCHFE